MKQPKLSDLKLDIAGTKERRMQAIKSKKIRITINFDSDVLKKVRQLASKNGIPYQSLLNSLVRQMVDKKKSEESRIDRLEKEVKKLKKKIAA